LEGQQVLAFVHIPIEMVADYQKHIAILAVKGKTVNFIGFFDSHGAPPLEPRRLGIELYENLIGAHKRHFRLPRRLAVHELQNAAPEKPQ
jgi:hypothetical protein